MSLRSRWCALPVVLYKSWEDALLAIKRQWLSVGEVHQGAVDLVSRASTAAGVQATIAEKAKQAVADGANEKKSEQLLRGEFEKLLQLLRPETSVEKADLQQIKDKVFGPQTFFVTETRLTEEYLKDAGWLVRLWLSPPTHVLKPVVRRRAPCYCALFCVVVHST